MFSIVMTEDRARRTKFVVTTAVAGGGYLFTAWLLTLIATNVGTPGYDIRTFFLPAGEAVRSGGDVYQARDVGLAGFFWAPPWAIVYAVLSGLPWQAVYIVTVIAEIAAIRLMFGSWRRVGYVMWYPIVAFELSSGNINLIVGAALLYAQRGRTGPLAWAALAKLSPALALPPRHWRGFVVAMGVAVAITLPWLYLWPDWIEALLRALGAGGVGPMVPVPLWVRILVAAPLILYQRPWSRVLGAVIAIPGFYWQTLVLLLAPLAVWLDSSRRK